METKTLLHQWKAAHLLAGQNNEVSSAIMNTFNESLFSLKSTVPKINSVACQKCSTIFLPNNHVIRFSSEKYIQSKCWAKRKKKHFKKRSIKGFNNNSQRKTRKNAANNCITVLKIKCKSCNFVTKLFTEGKAIIKTMKKQYLLDDQVVGLSTHNTPGKSDHQVLKATTVKPKATSKLNMSEESPRGKRRSSGFVKKLSHLLSNNNKTGQSINKKNPTLNNNSVLNEFLTSI